MKKILLEYINMFAYTVIGLIFGLSFFLLFINFYHMQELSYVADISSYNNINSNNIKEKVETIKKNISVYDQASYNGNLNIYGLNTVKLNLESCIEIIESEDMSKYLGLDSIGIKDSYSFVTDFKNKILNDCLVIQIKSMFNTDTVSVLPNFNIIKPYVELNIDNLLKSVDYVQNNLENSDHYYFTTDNNKNNFFEIVSDSYTNTMNSYQSTLDLIVEISNWYRSIVVGG